MARPMYETNVDVANERAVANLLEELWRCRLVKLKPAYVVDFAAMNDQNVVLSFVEIKCRKYSMDALSRMGGVFVSLHKWTHARQHAIEAMVPFAFCVSLTGGVYVSVSEEHDGVRLGGRTDRQDDQDVEPVVMLSPKRFTQVAWASEVKRVV